MLKNKNRIKQQKVESEDVVKVKNLIILLVIVVLVCLGVYFLTNTIINKDKKEDTKVAEVEFDYNIATIGTMFNRPEKEYFVLLYSTENEAKDYESTLATYRSSDNYIKTYFVDLDKKINKSALSDKLNKKPTNSNEVSVKGATLYKIKNGKVTKCYSTLETITDALK